MLDVIRLRVLVAVARHGSVTAAARALNYAQPSISHHIARLEAETGARLLQRAGRGVRLTDAGRLLAERAEEIIGRLDAAEAELAAHVGLREGRVRLAAFPSALGTIVPAAAARLEAETPGMDLMLTEAEPPEALRMLRAGYVDVALVFQHYQQDLDPSPPTPAEDGTRGRLLLDEPVHLVTAASPAAHAAASHSAASHSAATHGTATHGAGGHSAGGHSAGGQGTGGHSTGGPSTGGPSTGGHSAAGGQSAARHGAAGQSTAGQVPARAAGTRAADLPGASTRGADVPMAGTHAGDAQRVGAHGPGTRAADPHGATTQGATSHGATSHGAAAQQGGPMERQLEADLAAYADHRWIAGCERCRSYLLRQCARAGFTPNVAFTTDDYVAVQALVAAGLGVTTLPGLCLRAARHPGITATALPGARRHVFAVTYGDPPDPPATTRLLDVLAQVAGGDASL